MSGEKKDELLLVGGQAVIEGVLMRGKDKAVVAVRTDSGKIVSREWRLRPVQDRFWLLKLPFVRGVIVLFETLVLGFRALSFSANAAGGRDSDGRGAVGRKELFFSFAFSIAFAVLLFVVGPLFLASVLVSRGGILFNVVDGIFRLLALLLYLVVISFFRDVQRIFQYHGAEHMAIHAYERGDQLSFVKIRKYPTMHPRCGTSFLLLVVLVSVLAFSVVNPAGLVLKLLSRIVLFPVIAGCSYELLRLGAKFEKNPFMGVLVFPGLLLQRITTKEPDEGQVEVAVAALRDVIKRRS